MATQKGVIEPYLFFEGRCEEAIEFYRKAVGAEVEMIMRLKDSPEPPPPGMHPPGSENGDRHVYASDGRCSGKPDFQGFSLSISAANEREADKLFAGLKEGGEVVMPL